MGRNCGATLLALPKGPFRSRACGEIPRGVLNGRSRFPQNQFNGSKELKINPLYKFGTCQLDTSRRILLRDGQSVTLTPKGFDLLLLLLKNRERVLSKEELMTRLWPDTFVDEANLSQNLFLLRKALGESAQEQRYIVTVRGTGYRFAADIQELPEETGIQLASNQQPSSRSEKLEATRGFGPLSCKIVIAMVLIAAAAGALYVRRNIARVSRTETDTVVLAASENTVILGDIENRTGDSVFDDTLTQALLIEIEQSPFLRVLSTQRVNETLKLMNLQPGSRLTRSVAMEVCQRANTKAVLTGSISAVGKEYLLALEAFGCRDGSLLVSEQGRSESKEGTLDALSRIASQIRMKLGESLPSVERFDRPLREVTTPSLEALKAYSTAAQMIREERSEPTAAKILERAIEIDPHFAMAYAYLAIAYYHMGDEDRAAAYQTKAYALRDRVSERERLLLVNAYHLLVTHDEEDRKKTLEQWNEEFPQDYIPLHELGAIYADLGQYDKCIEKHELAWKLEPKQPYSPTWIAGCHLALNHIIEARKVMDRALQESPDSPDVHGVLYETALMQHDSSVLQAQSTWSESQPAISNIAANIASALIQRGQVKAARGMMERQIAELREQGHPQAAAVTAARMALWEAEIGDRRSAREYSRQSRKLFRGRSNSMLAALALILTGDLEPGKSIAEQMAKRYPADTAVQRVAVPLANALVDMGGQHPETAVADLEPTVRYQNGAIGGLGIILYVRGLAYLQSHRYDDAATIFGQIIEHRGISPEAPEWMLAQLGLARAQRLADSARTKGAPSKAQNAYEAFFVLCKEADANFLPLQKAKAEYANLQ